MKHLRPTGLLGRLIAILLCVTAIDFAVNTLLFERASNFALQEDEAANLASQLTLSKRLLEQLPSTDRATAVQELSSKRFSLTLQASTVERPRSSVELAALRQQMLALRPNLAKAGLQLHLLPLSRGGDIGGSVVLNDGTVLSFVSHGRLSWTLTVGRVAGLLAPSLILLTLAWIALRAMLAPLNRLVSATAHVGARDPEPLDPQGPAEVKQLIHAFNAMQTRIHNLLASRVQTLLAIGHDLRTPLARLRLRLDSAGLDGTVRAEMEHDIREMDELLQSLQSYVDPAANSKVPERVDLAAMAMTLVDSAADHGDSTTYDGPDSLVATLRPVAVRRALRNLIDNALHYAGSATVRLTRDGETAVITVEDDGPGIPEDKLEEVQHAFVRLDAARARDTPGMGLGLAIVRRAIRNEGGQFALSNRAEGGLCATVRLPLAPE